MSVIYKFQKGLRLFVPFFSWRLYIFLRSFISMLTTTEIVSLANLYRFGSCFSLYVLILSLILLSVTRARVLAIHRLLFFRLLSFSCRLHVSYQALLMAFVCSKTLLIDLNLRFVKKYPRRRFISSFWLSVVVVTWKENFPFR